MTLENILIPIVGGLISLGVAVFVWPIVFAKKKSDTWKIQVGKRLLDLGDGKSDWKAKLIELDKTIEYCLQQKYNSKDSLGNNLKRFAYDFSRNQLNDIWQAHKLRNNLVHNFSYQAYEAELKRGVEILEREVKRLIEN